MATSFVDEYLIKLGSSVDQSGMQRFSQALREATNVAEASAASIAGAFFKAQTEIVGGFAAIGSAALGMVDKVAMADQQYRLFALDMHISKDAARNLQVTMEALGATMGQIQFDPELRERARELIAAQRGMAPDGDFEAQMKKVRDIRFEFTMLEVEVKYLAMNTVNDFLRQLGMGPDDLLKKLRGLNSFIQHDMPEISHKLATMFLPVWMDVQKVFFATEKAFEAAGLAFTNLVGIFDHSLGGTTFDFEKFGKAITDIVDTFATWAVAIANVEEGLMHIVSALALVAQGRLSAAGKELGAASDDVNGGSVGASIAPGIIGSILGMKFLKGLAKKVGLGGEGEAAAGAEYSITGELAGGAAETGGVVAGAVEGAEAGSVLPGWGTIIGALVGGGLAVGGSWLGSNALHKLDTAPEGADKPTGSSSDIGKLIDRYASMDHVDPALARAVANTESSGRQTDASGRPIRGYDPATHKYSSATGVFQLLRGTASDLGVDPSTTEGNVKGGVAYLAQLLKMYGGNVPEAIGAYHDGPGTMNAVLSGQATLSKAGQAEIASVMRGMGAHGDVHVGSITIHIDKHSATNDDVGNAVVARLQSMSNKRVQRNLSEFQGWST